VTAADFEVEQLVQDQMDKCQFTLSQQEALCDSENSSCVELSKPAGITDNVELSLY
jgi:hypothetical protein